MKMAEQVKRGIVTRGKPYGADQARKSSLADIAQIPSISKEFWKKIGLKGEDFDNAVNSIDEAEDLFKKSHSIGVFGKYEYPGLLPTPVMISLAKALAFFKEIPDDPRKLLKAMNSEHSLVPSTSDFIYGYGEKEKIEGVINSPREEVDSVVDFYTKAPGESKYAYTLYGYTEVVIEGEEMIFKPKIRIVKLGKYNSIDERQVKEIVTNNAFRIAGGIDSFEGYTLGFFGDNSYVFEVQDIEYGNYTQNEIERLLLGEQPETISKQTEKKKIDLNISYPQLKGLNSKFFHLLMAGS